MTDWKLFGDTARTASFFLGATTPTIKNQALRTIAGYIESAAPEILAANVRDRTAGQDAGISEALLDRLTLTPNRIQEIVAGIHQVVALPDPVGQQLDAWTIPSGVAVQKVSVPLGVIGIIYEARPNVTVDASVLCLKAGNAVILRGSSSALESNKALESVIRQGLQDSGLPAGGVQLIHDGSRESVADFLQQKDAIDVVIPRGGAGLIQYVCQNSSIPVLETGAGNCHVFIDSSAPYEMAAAITVNGKTQRPSVCNAVETVLVHTDWAQQHLQDLVADLHRQGVRIRACPACCKLVSRCEPATEEDWTTEYLDLTLALRIVGSVEEAVGHINRYGTRHSECIVTGDQQSADYFLQYVDAAAVYHNASTRFTDGFEFGFGAEIGISTQKLHARGPMGLSELTSYKYLCRGQGEIRK